MNKEKLRKLYLYKLYLQTYINIRDGYEVAGDRNTLKILKKELKENQSERNNKINNRLYKD